MEFNIRYIPLQVVEQSRTAVLMNMFSDFQGDSMSIQRPSALVKSYSITSQELQPTGFSKSYGETIVDGPLYKCHIVFELDMDAIRAILDSWANKREYILHRSRVAAIAVRRLCYTENDVRLARRSQRKVETWKPDAAVVAAAQRAWLDFEHMMLSSISIGVHTEEFISAHKHSHVSPGVLWTDLTISQLEELRDAVKMHLEDRLEQGSNTDLLLHPYDMHYGLRARSPELPSPELRPAYDIEISRTRIVTYRGAMSGVFAFVPHEIELKAYQRAIGIVAKAAGFTFSTKEKNQVHSPILTGGKYYREISSSMQQYTYAATDGSNWEINVPTIIPGILAYTYVGSTILPSGSHDTSLIGSLASLVLAHSFNGVEELSVQGDDLGLFYKSRILYKDIPGLSELDPLDTKFRYALGYSYDVPDMPHSIGLKLTTDSSEHMLPRSTDSIGPSVSRGLDAREIARYVAVYTGILPDGRTLLEELEKLPAGGEMYPRKHQEMILNGE